MPTPGEYKTLQSRILQYAQEIGWTYMPREEAERRRGFDPSGATPEKQARKWSISFGDFLAPTIMAQIRVHDLDLDDILQQSAAKIGEGLPPRGEHAYETGVVENRLESEDGTGSPPFSKGSNSAIKGIRSQ